MAITDSKTGGLTREGMKAKKLQELREQLDKSKRQGEEDKRKLKSM